MAALTRGPLPARVYWTRRLVVLATVVLLVVGVARLLPRGEEPTSDGALVAGPTAPAPSEPTPADPGPTAVEPDEQQGPGTKAEKGKKKQQKKQKKAEEPVLAEPEGDCLDRDVAVTPNVGRAVAGDAVIIALDLRTALSPACTWRVSPETLTVKITSGSDDIWTSRQCARAIPTREVVVRRDVTTTVDIRWSGRRSDAECTRFTDWALPGWYHVAAAAFAGEPSDLQFELVKPSREVIVKQPKGQKNDQKNDQKNKDKDKPKPRDKHVDGPGQD